MSLLRSKIELDIKELTKNRNYPNNLSVLKLIKGEWQRLPSKDVTDRQIISIIKLLIKNQKELATYGVSSEETIKFLESLLPEEQSKMAACEIRTWIDHNIDFNKYPVKMKAMKDIMAQLKGKADGNIVKSVLEEL